MAQIEVHPDTAHLNRAAAEHFVRLAQAATVTQGSFAVVLSGGSTPTGMYRLLATPEFADCVDWPHVGQENHSAGHPFRFVRMVAPQDDGDWQVGLLAPVKVDERTVIVGEPQEGSRVFIWASRDEEDSLLAIYANVLDPQPLVVPEPTSQD